MSVSQRKGETSKVRPVLDFRGLNKNVMCLTGGTSTCEEKLKEWRKFGHQGSVIDLKQAYLQIHVARELWTYQAVRWNRRVYLLTWMGFGLNVAPRIMTAIVGAVLAADSDARLVTSSYIDDIFVMGGQPEAERVRLHLEQFELQAKVAEQLGGTAEVRALGLRVDRQLAWRRDGELPTKPSNGMTRRALHSWVGELVGQFPVAGWLRVACGYLQRCTATEGIAWDSVISEGIQAKANDVAERLRDQGDPVYGSWPVDLTQEVVLWTDASSVAIGVALEVGGEVVKDAAWLRRTGDARHINMSKLEAVIRGINMCLRWKIRQFTLRMDSATVCG